LSAPIEAPDAITRTARPRLNPTLARQRNVILATLLAVAALAWVLVVRQASGEDDMTMSGLGLTTSMGASAFIGMWALMMIGMMFPASAPMILTFSTIQARRRAAGRPYVPASLFTMSYILVWVTFGVLALGLAAGMDTLADRSDWLMANWSRIAGALLVAAGVYQLTPLKHICLRKCRTPMGFLLEHWRDGRSGAFAMGLNHGLYCAGCCWLLFVILVALGVMNLAVMAPVGAVVFAEKTLPRGEWIARVAGVGLIAYGAFVLFFPGALPGAM
jgi:predicted metal-binding membrane protein